MSVQEGAMSMIELIIVVIVNELSWESEIIA